MVRFSYELLFVSIAVCTSTGAELCGRDDDQCALLQTTSNRSSRSGPYSGCNAGDVCIDTNTCTKTLKQYKRQRCNAGRATFCCTPPYMEVYRVFNPQYPKIENANVADPAGVMKFMCDMQGAVHRPDIGEPFEEKVVGIFRIVGTPEKEYQLCNVGKLDDGTFAPWCEAGDGANPSPCVGDGPRGLCLSGHGAFGHRRNDDGSDWYSLAGKPLSDWEEAHFAGGKSWTVSEYAEYASVDCILGDLGKDTESFFRDLCKLDAKTRGKTFGKSVKKCSKSSTYDLENGLEVK